MARERERTQKIITRDTEKKHFIIFNTVTFSKLEIKGNILI